MIAFLHTAAVHTATFDSLLAQTAPQIPGHHVVRPDLLSRALEHGPQAVAGEVREALLSCLADGVRVIVCTCSTIGGVAEGEGAALPVPVLRLDRPLAEAAVAAGTRPLVVAAVPGTVAPSLALIDEVARAAGRAVAARPLLVADAWPLFERGELDAYWRCLAEAVSGAAADHDVVVLAQASMAGAVPLLAGHSAPVLASPELAVRAAAAMTSPPVPLT